MTVRINASVFVNRIKNQEVKNNFSFIDKKEEVNLFFEDDSFSGKVSETKESLSPRSLKFEQIKAYADKNLLINKKKVNESSDENANVSGTMKLLEEEFESEPLNLLQAVFTKAKNNNIFSAEKIKSLENLITKVLTAKKLDNEDLTLLSFFGEKINEKATEIAVSPNELLQVTKLIKDILANAREQLKEEKKIWHLAGEIEKKITELATFANLSEIKMDPKIPEYFLALKDKYSQVKNSASLSGVIIFSGYLDQLMKILQEAKSSGQSIRQNLTQLNEKHADFLENLFANKKDISYLGRELTESIFSLKGLEIETPNLTENKKFFSGLPTKLIENIQKKNSLKFSEKENSYFLGINFQKLADKFLENNNLAEILNKIVDKTQDLLSQTNNYALLNGKKRELGKNLRRYLNSEEYKQSWQKMLAANMLMHEFLSENVDELIAIADKMEDSMDLSVDPEKANIINLFRRFREIIAKLDLELRKARMQEEAITEIDTEFMNKVKENNEYQKYLDSNRDKLQDILLKNKEKIEKKFNFELGMKKN